MTGIGAHSDQSPSKNPMRSERTHGQEKPRRHANLIWPWEPDYLGDYKPEKLHDLEHGTVACYRQHNRLGTPPCQPCLDAMSLWARQQRLNSKQPA
jgi:hypothetical protein